MTMKTLLRFTSSSVLVVAVVVVAIITNSPATHAFAPLAGVSVNSVRTEAPVDLADFLTNGNDNNSNDNTMLVFGTYAADFNAIEYAQRLRYYAPLLREQGLVQKIGLVLNCDPAAARALAARVDLFNGSENNIELLTDPTGAAGRAFGVGRGWRPDDASLSPYLKLFGMLWGLGAWATLPAVLGGYVGNPFGPGQPWIADALAVGQRQGRWPDTALVLDDENILENKFDALPVVGSWPRPPLELATLRLQNMLDISIKNWQELAPTQDAMKQGVLTQLGGCLIVKPSTGEVLYDWKDPGICAVANFEFILKKLNASNEKKQSLPEETQPSSLNEKEQLEEEEEPAFFFNGDV